MAKQSATANTQDAPVDIQPSVKEMHDLPLVLVIVVTAIFVMSVGIYIDRPYKGNASYLIGFSLIAFVYIGAFIRKAEGLMSRALWLWCGFGAIIFLIPTFISAMGWWGLNDKEVADMIITSLTWLLLPTCFLWMNKSAKTMEKERVKRNQDALREVGGSSSILCNITLKHLHALPTRLYGQETAERTLLKAAKAHDGMGGKPFSAVFCGASGVGKTQLAENLSRVLGMPLIQFNMGEISSGTGMDNSPGCESRLGRNSGKDVLIGMPTGYVGAEKGGLLTNALKRNRKGIFLFDEMEKAGSGIYDLFLNCLDKGWINDARGNRYDCSEATFIFTTNVARDVDPALPEAKIKDKMIRAGFRPELMGRINKAVVFKPLTPDVARDLTIQMFKSMGKSVALKSNKTLPTVEWKPQKAAVDFFLNDLGYEVYGVRAIQKAVKELWQEVMAKDAHKVVFYPCRHKAPKLAKGEIAIALGTAEPIDLAAMRKHVLAKVKGQDHAMDTIIDQLEIREMGMVAKAEQPEGTFLFTGPSGTGKTEMVKQVADFLGRKFIIFNMGNFKGENGVEAFFGPPPGYTGSEKGGSLLKLSWITQTQSSCLMRLKRHIQRFGMRL